MKTTAAQTKTVTKAEWMTYRLISAPTFTTGMIKRDADGQCWLWVSSGKRVTIRSIR